MKRFVVASEAAQDLDDIWVTSLKIASTQQTVSLRSSTRTYECLPKRQKWATPAKISWDSAHSYSGRWVTTGFCTAQFESGWRSSQ
jgi:hypothetical protein